MHCMSLRLVVFKYLILPLTVCHVKVILAFMFLNVACDLMIYLEPAAVQLNVLIVRRDIVNLISFY